MARLSMRIERVLQSPDLRILSVMVAGIAVFGVVDGSLWRGLFAPTLAYRPAILFGLTLVFGWRGFVWSQLLFFISFVAFLGWRGGAFVTPLFLTSHACALVVARRLAKSEPWLLGEKSTLAFLAGAVLAPAVPALLDSTVLPFVGIPRASVPGAIDGWLRGGAGIWPWRQHCWYTFPGRYRTGPLQTPRMNGQRSHALQFLPEEGLLLGAFDFGDIFDHGESVERLAAGTMDKVFDPFFTTKSAGRGLGLAVVQGIVRSLGGTIHLGERTGPGNYISSVAAICEDHGLPQAVP